MKRKGSEAVAGKYYAGRMDRLEESLYWLLSAAALFYLVSWTATIRRPNGLPP